MADLFAPPTKEELSRTRLGAPPKEIDRSLFAPPSEEERAMAALEAPQMGTLEALKEKVKAGAFMGLKPVVSGAAEAIGQGAGILASEGIPFGDRLSLAVKNVPKAFETARAEEAYKEGEATGLLGPLGFGVELASGIPGAKAVAPVLQGAGMLSTALKSGAFGAGQGFLQGYGATGDVESAEDSALIGGGIGVLGGMLAGGAAKAGKAYQKPLKSNKGNIEQAAKNIGVKPTPGMLVDDELLQRTETSLAQKPTVAGQKTAQELADVSRGVESAAETVLSQKSGLTPTQTGLNLREEVVTPILTKGDETAKAFETVRKSTGFIDLKPSSVEAVARNIDKIKATFPGGKGYLESWSNTLRESVKTADDLKSFRTAVGNELQAARQAGDSNRAGIMAQIYKKLSTMESMHLRESTREIAKQSGKKALKGTENVGVTLVKELKDARQSYKEWRKDIAQLSRNLGFSDKLPPEIALKRIEEMEPKVLAQKLFNLSKPVALGQLQKLAPKGFETARRAFLGEIYEKIVSDNKINVGKFVREFDKLEPESIALLLKGNPVLIKRLNDIKVLFEAYPSLGGASGTPQGNLLMNFIKVVFSPVQQGQDLLTRRAIQKASEGAKEGAKAARGLLTGTQVIQGISAE